MDPREKEARRMIAAELFEQGGAAGQPDRGVAGRGTRDYGFATGHWTLKRIRRVIAERFGITDATLSGVWRLLRRIGYGCSSSEVSRPVRR